MTKRTYNLLELVPRTLAEWENDGDRVRILLPRFGSGRIGRFLERHLKSSPIRVRLDEFGSAVWQLCNGKRNVQEIADSLLARFGSRIQPVHDRLATFFRQLEHRGLIEWAGLE